MTQNKKIICIFGLIVLASLLIPKIALYLLEDSNINKIYITDSNMFATNNLKSENAIIRTIYSKYSNEKYKVSTGDKFEYATAYTQIEGETFTNDTLVKLKALEDIGMIKSIFFEYIKSHNNMIARINDFESESITYSKTRIFLPNDNYSTAFMSFEVENRTGKIIALKIPKEYVNSNKDVMKNYIKYLGLESDNWNYESNSIKSVSSQIEIKIEDINNIISLSIVPYNN